MIAALPVGGTTGLCHESTHAIDEAATWLSRQSQSIRIADLCGLFGLAISDALVARVEANILQKLD